MASAASSNAPVLAKGAVHGVAPLRAGQGTSFLLRRLHSLSGIVPVGAFLFEHILISNASAIGGPEAYARQVSFLSNLPLVFFLELFGIWLPIVFHALYGFYIWYRGDGNTVEYPWTGNWMYTAQRWRHRIRLHRLAHVDDALHRRGSARVSHRFIWQGAARSTTAGAIHLLCSGTDRRILAFCLWHLAFLGKMGDCFWRESAEAVPGRVYRIFLSSERSGAGQPGYVPVAAAATIERAGQRGARSKPRRANLRKAG